MPKGNWKSLALLASVSAAAALLFIISIFSLLKLPILGWTGLAPWAFMLLLTLAASRLTVPLAKEDGVSQCHKSVADTFIFLAVMIYAIAPAESLGPAIVLAGAIGFISSCQNAERRITVFTTGSAIISTA
ncbi:MAG TPA: hypothetical protein VK619_19700, partial [Pyrinomonadaceae bacterium]|nr:hypothetical protein [Pyrinomonadaceae bacterium]